MVVFKLRINKILNNNVVTVIDVANNIEKVVMGRGLGFKKKIGEEIDESLIEKVFSIENPNENLKFQKLVHEIPLEYFKISERIISYAKGILDVQFDEHIYIALTDHLSFAIKRINSGIEIKNYLLWEIQNIYIKEYEVGLWAVTFIKKELDISMGEDEAGFIALHLINASISESIPNTINITSIVQNILNIVKYYFTIDFAKDDLSYDRLVTHLKFFAKRIITKKQPGDDDKTFFQIMKDSYQEEFNCACKIKLFIEKNYDYKIIDSELVYLTMHLRRIVASTKK